jgi:DNA replication and repair protein RecF
MLTTVSLTDFRSHSALQFGLSPRTNVILGPNGSGKTNILEAVLMLGVGKSFRASDRAVIRFSTPAAKVAAGLLGYERALKLEVRADEKVDKTFAVEGKKYKRLSFHKTIPMVLFEPNFMQLISRGPEIRRDYFDGVLSRTQADYQALLGAYRRTLAQRNSLLKQPLIPKDQLFVWDIKLGELAGKVVLKRIAFVELLNRQLSHIYSQIAGTPHTVEVLYVATSPTKEYVSNLIRGFQKTISTDKDRGFTSLGPHRDDFSFLINGEPAVTSASRGENRTLLLSLKIIEATVLEDARNLKPILLLDDVFSELDETRQTALVDYFKDNQVIITTTTITPLIQGVSGKIIEL